MQYTTLGRTGLRISKLIFGCSSYGSKDWMPWALSEEDAQDHYRQAFESGITAFDTAESYSSGLSEEFLGRAIKRFGEGRDRVVIGTKIAGGVAVGRERAGLSRKDIRHAVDESLRRLGTDYIDLYQIHRLDPATPFDELIEGLDDVIRAGKVLYIGASSMHAWQFAKLQHTAGSLGFSGFVSMQNKYNLLYREEEREMLPLCADLGVAVTPYSPLARGLLAGSRKWGTNRSAVVHDFQRESDGAVIDAVAQIASERGLKPAQIALAWLLTHPLVTAPIVGATRVEHISDAVAALDIALSSDEVTRLEEHYVPQHVQHGRNEAPKPGQTASADYAEKITRLRDHPLG